MATPLASLDGTSWSLLEGEGLSVPEQVTMGIAFGDGRINGSSGCNRFAGTYEEDGASISFGPLAATRRACADDIMTAEDAYLSALGNVSAWSATDTELTLSNETGDELLRYASAEVMPPTGFEPVQPP